MNDDERLTPIICAGTACENTIGDLCMDSITYFVIYPMVLFAVYSINGFKSTLYTTMMAVVTALWLFIWAKRYLAYRRRVATMRAGVARLLELRQQRQEAVTEARPAPVTLPEPVKFRDTKLFKREGALAPCECAVCLDPLLPAAVATELACGHCFHHPCAAAWAGASTSPTCPVCRGSLCAEASLGGPAEQL